MINVSKVYNRLGDDYSKDIYINRILYSMTEDSQYMKHIISSTVEGKDFLAKMYAAPRIMIFSAGNWGRGILQTFTDINFEGFVDNKIGNGEQGTFCGKPVISFQEYLSDYSNDTHIIIATRLYYNEIYQQLLAAGVSEKLIINAGKMTDEMSKRQYFDLPELRARMCERECFVDAGSFDGKTTGYFVEWCKQNSLTKIIDAYAFEPDEANRKKCEEYLNQVFENVSGNKRVIGKGLWSAEEVLKFNAQGNGNSTIDKEGDVAICVDKLDNLIESDDKVTFVKMDLEGAEYQALLGARKIITECKPKMAISVYHKSEDIFEIPSLLLEMNPDYTFYLGHYSIAFAETVLYAI